MATEHSFSDHLSLPGWGEQGFSKTMGLVTWVVTHIAPIFLITSPVTSYADQMWSISKTRSSAGFSLDIPLIMLVASILKIFYWFGARYDFSLLIQAGVMVGVQTILLHVALLNRPPIGAQHSLTQPFAGSEQSKVLTHRPFNFWQWRARKPYWHFLLAYTGILAVLQILFSPGPFYTALQGYTALSVEAILPLPQIYTNHQSRSCKGFRLSVLANWLIGDAFKMTYFFLAGGSKVPWAFKLCGLFQAVCDAYLGVQYWMYGEGVGGGDTFEKDGRVA